MSSDNQNNLQQIPLLTFNSLYNILREEKKVRALQTLPELFYEAIDKYMNDKKNEIGVLKQKGEKEKFRKEKHIFDNSKKIIEELINIRCVKIANIAIKNEIFGEGSLEKNNILEKEEYFFQDIAKATSKFSRFTK